MDQKTDLTKLLREAENEAITFNGIRDQGSDDGNQEEPIGDGANIHHGPSNESNQEL